MFAQGKMLSRSVARLSGHDSLDSARVEEESERMISLEIEINGDFFV